MRIFRLKPLVGFVFYLFPPPKDGGNSLKNNLLLLSLDSGE